MAGKVMASIIINNYNYARFLKDAIDSALQQSYPNVEVIVVDDGSTDNSRAILATYRSRVISILKENGGQASAFNAGFAVSRGDIIVFLDSDDMLLHTAVENAVKLFNDQVSKVHWPLRVIDERGADTGHVLPETLPEGDLREAVIRGGPQSCVSPPTTGNAWARNYLKRVLPVPEDMPYYRICADEYLFNLAPLCGQVRRIEEPQGLYRIHGQNTYSAKPFEEKLRLELSSYDDQCLAMQHFLRSMDIDADTELWKQQSWFHRLRRAIDDISSVVPAGDTLVLVDDDKWAARELAGRRCVPFMERNGVYWGAPSDDTAAIQELHRLQKTGANFIVFGWPAFWWIEYYAQLHQILRSQYRCVLENERLVVFDLRRQEENRR